MGPIDNVLAKLEGTKPSGTSGRQWVACCPAHEDNQQSLAVAVAGDGRVLLKCYAGCKTETVLTALGMTFGDLYDQEASQAAPAAKITVAQLAWDKRLPADFLKAQGLSNLEEGGVEIAYLDERRKRVATRYRTALTAKEGSKWATGDKPVPYGLWRLSDVKDGKLTLVEGESDAWTLWHHGIAALGIPGADMAKKLELAHLAGVKELYVWQEPGQGGETFVNGVGWRLKELKWEGTATVISGGATKDPNALHMANPEGFREQFAAILAAAKPMPAPTKVEKKKREKPKLIVADIIPTLAEEWNKRPVPAPGFFPSTDSGNAERLAFRHGKELRYVEAWGKWLIWNESYWRVDDSGEIFRRALETVRAIHAEARAPGLAADKKTALEAHAVDSESYRRRQAMCCIAESVVVNGESIPIVPDLLDADPWLLNVQNGVVDLRTGKCRPAARADFITKQAAVAYDAAAKCPTWLKFLDRIMGGSQSLIEFLQRAVGYSLTAVVSEKCFFFLYGTGDNGKSVFVETVENLLGDYQAKTTADTILDRGAMNAIPNDVARLIGVRFVSTAELPENRRLDEARVKDLTGRDTISARFMRREWFQFRPKFKLWMYGNHKPSIRGADEGIWRRVRLVPFAVSIPKAEQDEELPAKLRAELPGILNWAIAGCLAWQKGGLPIPDEVQQATADYRSEQDVMAEFLDQCCLLAPNAGCLASELYSAYREWAKENGEYVCSGKKFGMILKDRGFRQSRTSAARGWIGLSVLPKSGGGKSDTPTDLSDFDS